MKNNKIVYRKVTDLKPHPFNAVLYDFKNDDRTALKESLVKWFKKTGTPTKEILKIDKNNIIYSGNRRWYVCNEDEKLKKTEVKCEIIDHTLDEHLLITNCEYTQNEMAMLDEYNEPNVIRNQTSWPVVLRKYYVANDLHNQKTGKNFSNQERNKWCNEKCNFSNEHFKKMSLIYSKKRSDLILKVSSGEYSVAKAYSEAMDVKEKSKLKYDKKRKNWVKYFKNKKLQQKLVKYANNMIDQFLNITLKNRKIILDKKHGHEPQFISTFISNAYMSAVSVLLEEEGFESCTPREEVGLPDVRILCITKEGYHPERIEIKVAQYQGTPSSTKVTAGIGATRIVPHTFVLITYDPINFRQFVVMSDLEKKDWTANKSSNKCEMSFSTFGKNHSKNCTVIHGDAYISKNNNYVLELHEISKKEVI